MSNVNLSSAFNTDDPTEIRDRLETLKGALDGAPTTQTGWSPDLPGFRAPEPTAADHLTKAIEAIDASGLGKAAGSGDVAASLRGQLQSMQADLVKDLTLTSPLSTGYVAYDLEAPAKLLVPRPTPLRNMLPRVKGIGTARRYKRITGFTGSGTGGVGNVRPGVTDSTSTAFAGVNYVRGPKIGYAGDEAAVPYLQFSLSDSVPWSAQFAGQGFQDIRQLSQTALLYSSMLMEERLLLGGRGTASGFAGALAAPGTPTITVRNANTGEVGNSANIASLVVSVTAVTTFGETVVAQATTTGMSAATGKVVDVSIAANVAGAQGYKVYCGVTAGVAAQFPAALTIAGATNTVQATAFGNQVSNLTILTTVAGCATINFTGAGTGGVPNAGTNPPAAATDSSALDYDGIVTICTGANSGYNRALGTVFSANPGDEYNQAFASLYDSVKADPDLILLNGNDRKQLSDQIKLNSNTSAYRITLTQSEAHDATIGAVVNGIQNEVTGKLVDLHVHPWLAQGISPILSLELPIPDTEVSSCFSVVNVQDYMSVQWPVTQFAYEASTYWFGTFLCYAPAWQGCLTNIIKK